MCRRPFCCSAAGASVISGRFFCRLRRWLMGFCMVFAVKNFCQRRSGRFFSAQKEVGRYHRCWFSDFQTPLGHWHKRLRRSPNIFRSQLKSTISENGSYVKAWRTSAESSTTRWVMTIEVGLKIPWSMHSHVNGLSASRN